MNRICLPMLILCSFVAPQLRAMEIVYVGGGSHESSGGGYESLAVDADIQFQTALLAHQGNEVAAITAEFGEGLDIQSGQGLGPNAVVTHVKLYQSVAGSKGQFLGEWKRSQPQQQPNSALRIEISGNGVSIRNVNGGSADVTVYFSVTAVEGGSTFESDPELVVRKKRST